MFDGFQQPDTGKTGMRMAASTLLSAAVYGVIGVGAFYAARSDAALETEKEVAVKFAPPPPAPPPPPPPPVAVIPENKPVKKVAAKPIQKLTEPQEIPEAKLEQADPADYVPEVAGDGEGTEVATLQAAPPPPEPPPPPPPPPPAPAKRAPVNLPEDATPPVAADDNLQPEYPPQAREQGAEGLVILKIVVTAEGAVGAIQVLKGDEPFVAAALAAVKTWRYSPAIIEGQPAPVFRIVKIPFHLKK